MKEIKKPNKTLVATGDNVLLCIRASISPVPQLNVRQKMNAILQSTIIAAMATIFAGCGTVTHNVNRPQLARQLAADTEATNKGGSGYQWSYIGSSGDAHYFRRQDMRMFYSELRDGFYALPKNQLDIGSEEFMRPSPDHSGQWKQAFTQQDRLSLRQRYSLHYGIKNWTPLQKRIGEQDATSTGG